MSESAPTTSPAPEPPKRQVRSYTFRGEGTWAGQPALWNFGRLLSRIISVLLFKFRASGQSHVPESGPVLMVTNHQSFLDPWLIGIALHRQVHYMARDTLFKGGVLHWLMERLNAFPIKRGTADRAALSAAVERLEKGFIVNIFPEGTRSEDGTIGPIAPGLAIILNRCKRDVPIVPVLIDGAFAAWPRNRKLPHPQPIRLHYGKPIPKSEWSGLKPDELAQRIRARLVALQEQLNSPYAAASKARLETKAQ